MKGLFNEIMMTNIYDYSNTASAYQAVLLLMLMQILLASEAAIDFLPVLQ
jgi:hypothetical protein